MNVIFIGYRGTGKTTVGKLVARRLKRNFVDIDDVIVATAGKSIPKIFKVDGEAKFRKLETACIKKVCTSENLIIGFGGGAVMNPENVKAAKKSGKIVLLFASPKVIYQRISGDANRPALTKGKSEFDEIKFMLKKRAPTYKASADFVVKNDGRTIRDSVREIITILEKEKIVERKRNLSGNFFAKKTPKKIIRKRKPI